MKNLMAQSATPTVAVFASDKGAGDAERASIMSQAAPFSPARGRVSSVLADGNSVAIPLVTSRPARGGEILIVADQKFALPRALSGVPLEQLADADARLARVAELADAFIGLPGSLASISNLYLSWLKGGWRRRRQAGGVLQPQQCFEVLRGYSADVLSHSIPHHERYVQFADSIEICGRGPTGWSTQVPLKPRVSRAAAAGLEQRHDIVAEPRMEMPPAYPRAGDRAAPAPDRARH